MKTIYKFLVLFAITVATASCTLEREDYTDIYDEQLNKTVTDIELQVNTLYYDWDLYSWMNICNFNAETSGIIGSPWITNDIRYQQWTLTTGIQGYAWTEFARYNYISQARNVIRGIENSDVAYEDKKVYLGEAKALRAYMAVYLYGYFGTVPVPSDEILDNPEEFVYIGRLSEEEYDNLVIGELTDAIDMLPVTPSAKGRVSKGFAMMTLLRYYMMRNMFDKAETVARDIVDLGVYDIVSSYEYLFSDAGMENNEIIWQLVANKTYRNQCNFFVANALPTDMPWTANSTGWGAGAYMYWDFYDSYEDGDKRLVNVFDGYTSLTGKIYTRNDLQGAIPTKYGKDEDMQGDQCVIDVIVYRYADVILRLAECIVRNTGTVTAEAVDLVNRIRNRAGLDNLPSEKTASVDVFMEALLWERLHELFLEGYEREDQIRFGVYVDWCNERINAANAEQSLGLYNIDDSHNMLFIPQGFIDESQNKITQNPGY